MNQAASRRVEFWVLLLGLSAWPVAAQAHSPMKGAGDFVNGALHPLTTLSHVLIILGIGLMAGRRVPLNLRPRMTVFVLCAAAALTFTTLSWVGPLSPAFLIGIAICPGVLLALERELPTVLDYLLLAGAAIALGLDSAVESGPPSTVIKMLMGTWVALSVLVVDIALYVSMAGQAKWLKIALRVAGSWMTAISLLMLAFAFRR